jgi:hypothetical protein
MKEEPGSADKRDHYESPKLRTISLRPEEAVLGNCKNMSAAGPVSASCSTVPHCMTVGS